MIQYAINSIICSGLLFLLYKLLLESEKMHVFKRFFLLLSVVVSLTAPLITLSFASSPEENIVLPFISKEPVHFIYKPSPIPVTEESNYLFLFLTVAYLAGVALNLLRFGKRVAYFFKVQSNKEQLVLEQARLVLVDEQVIPHSFLNSIFLNKEDYRKGLIEPEILVHELAHVKQLHSLDILFAQLIQCVFWFNPFFIYYIKAIQLNHEFLADGAAASSSPNPLYYQQLLLTKASTNPKFSLASQFNFLITKKRLLMISKNTSPEKKLLKQLIALPLLIAISFVFAGKEVTAQVTPPKTDKVVPSTTSGASQSLMNEYKAIVDEHKIGHINGLPEYSAFSDKEQGRLLNIFQQMTKQQQNEMNIIFRPKGLYLKKNNPTEAQLKAWLDSKTYGVWVGAERINNNELANYKPADFSWFNVSRLTKTAKNYGKHVYQVSLMTNSEFAQKIKEWNAVPDLVLSIRNGKLNFEGNRFMFVKQP